MTNSTPPADATTQPAPASTGFRPPVPRMDLSGFNFNASAELFPSRIRKGRPHLRYRRFETAAEAVRFAVEEVPAASLLGAYIEANEARFGIHEINELYASAAFPLKRAAMRKAG